MSELEKFNPNDRRWRGQYDCKRVLCHVICDGKSYQRHGWQYIPKTNQPDALYDASATQLILDDPNFDGVDCQVVSLVEMMF